MNSDLFLVQQKINIFNTTFYKSLSVSGNSTILKLDCNIVPLRYDSKNTRK